MMLDTFEVRLQEGLEEEAVANFFDPRNVYALREMLAYYATVSLSPENILAMIAILDYAKLPSMEKFNFIFRNFLSQGCRYEINVDGTLLRRLNDARQRLVMPDPGSYRSSRGRTVIAPHRVNIPLPSDFFDMNGLYIHLIVDIGEAYKRFSDAFMREDNGFTYVRHVDVTGNRMASEVKEFLLRMVQAGFNISPKLLRLDS
jgi:hypothetical protein